MIIKLFLLFPKSLSLFAEEKVEVLNPNHEHSEKEGRVQSLDGYSLSPQTLFLS